MATDPSACRHCGVSERQHCNRWMPDVGWHQWTEPAWEQRRQRLVNNAREAQLARRQRQYRRLCQRLDYYQHEQEKRHRETDTDIL